MDPEFLSLLRCPRTGAQLRWATAAELACINAEILAGPHKIEDQSGFAGELQQSLICDSAKLCYPVRDGLPVLLPDAALDLPKSLDSQWPK